MDAAEYVLSDSDRLARADPALDQLSDAVTDNSMLHIIASLDAAADVSLLLQTGQVGCTASSSSVAVRCCSCRYVVPIVLLTWTESCDLDTSYPPTQQYTILRDE
jgi:hypothetical protein